MTTSSGPGAGSPFIAGAGISTADIRDTFDEEYEATSFYKLSNSPDTLQSLDIISSEHQKHFLSSQALDGAPVPDSPSSSFHDSSSESATSWKRNDCSASSKVPSAAPDVKMEDGMQWASTEFGGLDDMDNTYIFGQAPSPNTIDETFASFDQDDSFMEQSFDFESAASSPKTRSDNQTKTPTQPQFVHPGARKKALPRSKIRVPTQKKRSGPTASSKPVISLESREVSPTSAPPTGSRVPSLGTNTAFPSNLAKGLEHFSHQPNWQSCPQSGDSDMVMDTLPSYAHQQPPTLGINNLPTPVPSFTQPSATGFNGQYKMTILPTPLKSRVETQIHIALAFDALPPGVTKLHLPTHTISKPKLVSRPAPVKSPDMLELHVTLVCTSSIKGPDMKENVLQKAASRPQGFLSDRDKEEDQPRNGGEVRICTGCITRERKRAGRKKMKKPEEERSWESNEERRVVVFNTQEVKLWKPLGNDIDHSKMPPGITPNHLYVSAPMRIACYCRHHGEKQGFNVIFTVKDHMDNVFAQAMSEPIMITDDHKTQPVSQSHNFLPTSQSPGNPARPSNPSNAPGELKTTSVGFGDSSGLDFGLPHNFTQPSLPAPTLSQSSPNSIGFTNATRSVSRSSSPPAGAPVPKKRKSSASRVPNGLAMTRLDSPLSPTTQATTAYSSTATSPYSTTTTTFSQLEPQIYGHPGSEQPYPAEVTAPIGGEQASSMFHHRTTSYDNIAMAQLYSAPVSNRGSRAPSPNGLRNSLSAMPQNQFAQALASSLYALPMATDQAPTPPVIHKIIPNEGPKIGGIEVTVLGGSFFQGLEVWFGDRKATTTTFWGESSLVCLLPPSPITGVVPVTFQRQGAGPPQAFTMVTQPPSFKYIDDSEEKLIRTALSVLAHKMSGNMYDIRDIARSILEGPQGQWANGGSTGGAAGGPPSTDSGPGGGSSAFQQHGRHAHLEPQLLKVLDLIDLDDSPHRTRLDLRNSAGHTMLHMACTLGLHRFVAALLARGANVDVRDKGGYTPLHLAAINNHPELVRRLMLVGANPTIKTLSNLTAADVAQTRTVLRAIEKSERQTRTGSRHTVHSRTSSATSLRSLWEPLSKMRTQEGPVIQLAGSEDESLEYTSGDMDDDSPDEDPYLQLRRPSRFQCDDETSDRPDAVPPQNTTVALFQQQLHQFQQALALHLPNITHLPQMPPMPQMPALPGMPMLPDYQAYLQQAPFVRRMQQFIPGTSAARDDSGSNSPPKLDARWWDISSYINNNAAPPPAYDDLFPQHDSDAKQSLAVQAAAEAEADLKCAAMYDEVATVPSQPSSSAEPTHPMPKILRIGRKHAITREQQEQFLRAREMKLKKLSNDWNLFLIWIPLLVLVFCAMIYSYFPSGLPFAVSATQAIVRKGQTMAIRFSTPAAVHE